MAMTSKRMELGFPIQGKLYSKSDLSRHIWEWSIITFQLINNIINILAIYAALVDRYWIIWCYTWLMFLYGMFGSSSIMTKGGYSPWLIPLICGQISIALTHQIGIRLQFKKSRSIN
ncbi:hypothetical protein BLOT_004236 [Blomia tropicalis]|nr:hypothetical protein BLOT_004236 [Blomia tropicalis]